MTMNVLLTKQQDLLLLDTVTASLFKHITGPLDLFVPEKIYKVISLNDMDSTAQ